MLVAPAVRLALAALPAPVVRFARTNSRSNPEQARGARLRSLEEDVAR
jgi:hypothetical protein